jgi:hypothetical protein
LTGDELLALQLRARGYTAEHIALVYGWPPDEVERLLDSACEKLGAPYPAAAVAAARRRGLFF